MFTVRFDTPDYLDTGSADYIIMHDGLGSGTPMSVTLSGAGVISGNSYSISVILDQADNAGGAVQETVSTVTGTFTGDSPQTIDISTLGVPTTYTGASVHSSNGSYPPGLSATVTTPNDSLSSTVTDFTYELAGADTFHLVYGPSVAFSGTTSSTTAAQGETLTASFTYVPGVSIGEGVTGSDLHLELEVLKDSDNTAAGTTSSGLEQNYGGLSNATLTLSNGLTDGETITAKVILRTGTTSAQGDTSVTLLEQQFTIV